MKLAERSLIFHGQIILLVYFALAICYRAGTPPKEWHFYSGFDHLDCHRAVLTAEQVVGFRGGSNDLAGSPPIAFFTFSLFSQLSWFFLAEGCIGER